MEIKEISNELLESLIDSSEFYMTNTSSHDNTLYFQGKRDAYKFLLETIFEKHGVSA